MLGGTGFHLGFDRGRFGRGKRFDAQRRSRLALPTTDSEDSAIAPAAIIGESRMPEQRVEHAGGQRDAEPL